MNEELYRELNEIQKRLILISGETDDIDTSDKLDELIESIDDKLLGIR